MKKVASSLFVLCTLASYAQNKRPFYCTALLGGSRAVLNFQADVNVPQKFHTMELKFGVCLIKPLSEHFDLRSRIGYGIKFRRTPDNRLPQLMPGKEERIIREIRHSTNEAFATQNSDFVDFPIILHYKVGSRLGVEIGFNYRLYYWFYDNPYLSFNYGPQLNLTYDVNKFSVFCGYTLGLKRLLGGGGSYPDDKNQSSYYTIYWSAKSNFFQWGIEYNLFKKLKEKGIRFPRVF